MSTAHRTAGPAAWAAGGGQEVVAEGPQGLLSLPPGRDGAGRSTCCCKGQGGETGPWHGAVCQGPLASASSPQVTHMRILDSMNHQQPAHGHTHPSPLSSPLLPAPPPPLLLGQVRTNLGGLAVNAMMRLHRGRLWLLLRLLAEDPYAEVRCAPMGMPCPLAWPGGSSGWRRGSAT